MDKKCEVLIVSSSEKSAEFIKAGISREVFEKPEFAQTAAEARKALSEKQFDAVIINYPLDDETDFSLAKQASEEYGTAVLTVVKKEDYLATVAEVETSGVACVSKPISKEFISQAARFLIAMRAKTENAGRKTESLRSEVEDLKVINRAKCLLMEKLGLGEEDAHRHLEKQAMDLCIRKSEAAKRIIMTYEI